MHYRNFAEARMDMCAFVKFLSKRVENDKRAGLGFENML